MIRRAALVAGMFFIGACERAKSPAPGVPGNEPSPTPSGNAAGAAANAWDAALGAVLATPSLDGGTPVMFARDTAATADIEVELFNHDDRTTRATLHPGAVIGACAWRRNALLITSDGKPAPNTWMLALSPGVATPFGIDGVAELLPRDSAATVARISRLVSAIPEDSASVPYHGLPIVVRDAWRFQLADSTTVAVAIAARSLNVESNPRAQAMENAVCRLPDGSAMSCGIAARSLNVESDPRAQAITLIAEPDPSAGAGQWRTVFSERVAGAEDRVEGTDLLAAFQLHGSKPAVALVREGDAGLQIQIIERTAPGAWNVRWTSVALTCARP